MFSRVALSITACGLGCLSYPAWSADLQSADTLLQQWTAKSGGEASAVATHPLRKQMENFRDSQAEATAEERAQAWVSLMDRSLNAAAGQSAQDAWAYRDADEADPSSLPSFLELVQVIPGPDSWPQIREIISNRPMPDGEVESLREQSLRSFAAFLNQDQQAFDQLVQDISQKIAAKQPDRAEYLLMQAIELTSGDAEDADRQLATFKESLDEIESQGDESYSSIHVPRLTEIAAEDEARQLLRRLLVSSARYIYWDEHEPTLSLARQVAVEVIDESKAPHWDLVEDISAESMALYEAYEKKYLQPSNEADAEADAGDVKSGVDNLLQNLQRRRESQAYDPEYDRYKIRRSQQYYLIGLIINDRTDDAEALVRDHFASDTPDGRESVSLPYGSEALLRKAGAREQLFSFAKQMVQSSDGFSLWPLYIELGGELNRSEQVLTDLQQALKDSEGEDAAYLRGLSVKALLAADQIDEGVAALQVQIENSRQQEDHGALVKSYVQLAEIGRATGRDDLQEQGIGGAVDACRTAIQADQLEDYSMQYAMSASIGLLVDAERYAEAQELLSSQIARVRQTQAVDNQRGYVDSDALVEPLLDLVNIYAAAERWADVLTLVEDVPFWGQDDLADLLVESGNAIDTSLGWCVAAALHHRGDNEQAQAILKPLLAVESNEDDNYELWLKVAGDDALPWLDFLFERDPYQERPLIWKAQWLLERDRLDEAEATIRQAIAVDPSDGEQGRGDRIRAYAVLSSVLEAKGDQEGADTMAGVERAIRQAEEADRVWQAGLLSRAVKMYEQSLTHFADAYCIQSRLAIRLADTGRFDEAVEHYEKAYELMPDSFGRIESHCFGCEGIFSDERTQPIAERVFQRMVEARPEKPQLHYLIGYLKDAQSRPQEALEHYRKAVELDPEYLNAWKNLSGLQGEIDLPQDEKDQAALTIFRLDPLGRHSGSMLSAVRDLPGMWEAVEAVQPLRFETPETLLPLPASAQALRQAKEAGIAPETRHRYRESNELPSPGEQMSEHLVAKFTEQLLEFSQMMATENRPRGGFGFGGFGF